MEFPRKSINKFYTFSIYSIAILFLTLYFILSVHSRIAGDDYFYLWLKNTFGAWYGMIYQYNNPRVNKLIMGRKTGFCQFEIIAQPIQCAAHRPLHLLY